MRGRTEPGAWDRKEGNKELAVLVALKLPKDSSWEVDESLIELEKLAVSAGAEAGARFVQPKESPAAATYIGRGKAEEIAELCYEKDIRLVVFDDELTPAQQRNLEELIPAKVLDRTQLILDIFAQRARTREGKLQVELAQLTYLLPRLVGKGKTLSRLGGGIGTRGPGETRLEVDRRRIRNRISNIKGSLKEVRKTRQLHRTERRSRGFPTSALVGYTNSGKSTLLNRLTDAHVTVANQLFSTLDPTVRKIALPDGQQSLLVDTVGFIRKIPHQLVAAFRATLEEVCEADLLLHVIDCSHPEMERQCGAVWQTLKELGAADKPMISVYNKIDRVPGGEAYRRVLGREKDAVVLSALKGEGIEELKTLIAERLSVLALETHRSASPVSGSI